MLYIIKYHLYFIVLFILFTSCIKEGDDGYAVDEIINYVEVGDQVPDFTVSDGEGRTFNSADFRGRRSLLILYITGCPDCHIVLPLVNDEVWPAIKDDPSYQLVTIARDETAEAVNKYWNDRKFTMPTYLDPGRAVFSLFANSTVPRLYIINTEGRIEWMAVEQLDLNAAALTAKIKTTQ